MEEPGHKVSDQGLLKVQKKLSALQDKNKRLQDENRQLKEKARELKHTHSRVSKLPKPDAESVAAPAETD